MAKCYLSLRNLGSTSATYYDMVVAGGGLVGSAMACTIGTSSILKSKKVLLLESGSRNPNKNYDGSYSNRVSAVAPASVELFKRLGIWNGIEKSNRLAPVSELYVEDGCSEGKINFRQKDPHSPIAHIVENDLIIEGFSSCLREYCKNVEFRDNVILDKISIPEGLQENVRLLLGDGECVETSILIAADGARSAVRAASGIKSVDSGYDQMAIVATLRIKPTMKTNSIAWQRFMTLGPVALLPLSDDLCSLVWSTSTAEAKRLLALAPIEFVEELNQTLSTKANHNPAIGTAFKMFSNFLNCLPAFQATPKLEFPTVLSLPQNDRAAFPLSFMYAQDYVRPRVALIGDAGHRIHPLAGQGVNIGWSDVTLLTATLETAVAEGGDLGSLTYLGKYDSQSQQKNVPKMVAIDFLNHLYSTSYGPSVFLRSTGFNILDRLLPAKDLIVRMAS